MSEAATQKESRPCAMSLEEAMCRPLEGSISWGGAT